MPLQAHVEKHEKGKLNLQNIAYVAASLHSFLANMQIIKMRSLLLHACSGIPKVVEEATSCPYPYTDKIVPNQADASQLSAG